MLNIVFCLPGNNFSSKFLLSWTKLTGQFGKLNIKPSYSFATGSDIFKLRNSILSGDRTAGKNQPLFRGKIPYDYIMWIDSDQVFEISHFETLLTTMQDNSKINILSGLYLDPTGTRFSAATHGDDSDIPHRIMPDGVLTPNSIKGKQEPLKVDFNGMGFMLVRKGVFESLDYPWFVPMKHNHPDILDFTGEDASFCLRAKGEGFPTYVHPQVVIGHEKLVVIQ